jgi:hypothetical protein
LREKLLQSLSNAKCHRLSNDILVGRLWHRCLVRSLFVRLFLLRRLVANRQLDDVDMRSWDWDPVLLTHL